MKLLCLLCVALLALGCGGTNTAPAHPIEPPRSLGEAPPPPSQTEAIPQFFLVEVSGDQVLASGARVDLTTLRTAAIEEAKAGQVRGAALTLKDPTTEQQALVVVQLLLEAGFRHVVLSSRLGLVPAQSVASSTAVSGTSSTPSVEDSPPVAVAPPPQALPSQALPSQALPEESVPSSSDGPAVEVKQMGLHIGGGPNDAEHHALYAEPITRRFEDIRQCYSLAQDNKKASFGVDLLIPSKGGRPKIENYRTAIGGKDFHLCVLGVFGSIEFKAPGKSTMVSYSVLFKPL
jgi:hypothetical protein